MTAMSDFPQVSRWCVVDDDRPGIVVGVPGTVTSTVTRVTDDGDTYDAIERTADASTVNVHFVDEAGLTTEEAYGVPVARVREAALVEIPMGRRPSAEANEALGYAE